MKFGMYTGFWMPFIQNKNCVSNDTNNADNI